MIVRGPNVLCGDYNGPSNTGEHTIGLDANDLAGTNSENTIQIYLYTSNLGGGLGCKLYNPTFPLVPSHSYCVDLL